MNIGFEKILLKNNKMIGFFIPNQQSDYYKSEVFSTVLRFVQKNSRSVKMKEGNNKLTLSFENIISIRDGMNALAPVLQS